MCCKNFWKKIIPFALAFLLGVSAASLSDRENSAPASSERIKRTERTISLGDGDGIGIGGNGRSGDGGDCGDCGEKTGEKIIPRSATNKILVLAKPRANYTDAARTSQTQGAVRLRVTFLSNGEIGAITPVTSLPNGLTEQAIAAARRIEFEPATRDGVPYTVTKVVEYTFTLY